MRYSSDAPLDAEFERLAEALVEHGVPEYIVDPMEAIIEVNLTGDDHLFRAPLNHAKRILAEAGAVQRAAVLVDNLKEWACHISPQLSGPDTETRSALRALNQVIRLSLAHADIAAGAKLNQFNWSAETGLIKINTALTESDASCDEIVVKPKRKSKG